MCYVPCCPIKRQYLSCSMVHEGFLVDAGVNMAALENNNRFFPDDNFTIIKSILVNTLSSNIKNY
jgi:hypothetical protein